MTVSLNTYSASSRSRSLMTFFFFIVPFSLRVNSSFFLSLPVLLLGWIRRSVMALSADLICGKIPGLTYKQRLLCAAKPDAMVAISNGAKLGLAECQEQFKYHRWNCTAIGSRNGFGHVVVVGKLNTILTKTFCLFFLLISF